MKILINNKTNKFLIRSCIIAGIITLLPLFFLIKIYYADYKENQANYQENQFNYYLEKYIANNPSLFTTKQAAETETTETESNDAESSPFNYSEWIDEKIKEYPANIEDIIKNPKPEKINYMTGSVNDQNLSVKQIIQQNSPAVVLVYTIDSVLSWSYGTGFIIADNGIIATNYHLFGDTEDPDNIYAERGAVILSDNKSIYPISSVLFVDREKDLIVIKIDEKNKKLPTVKLGDSDKIEQGDEVFTTGNMHDHLGIILDGFVSGFIKDEKIKQIQFSAFTTYGYSGGPLLNNRGQVIGVIAGSFVSQFGADFAIPINYLKDLIDKK